MQSEITGETRAWPATALDAVITGAIAAIFLGSFLTYAVETTSAALQAVPIIWMGALAVCGTIGLLHQAARGHKTNAHTLTQPHAFLALVVVPALGLFGAAFSEDDYSIRYGVLLWITLLSAKAIVMAFGLRRVINAFLLSSVFSILVLAFLTWRDIASSVVEAERFNAYGFHSNLLGFIFGGFLCWQITQAMIRKGTSSLLWLPFAAASAMIIVFASSRGSIVAVAIALICGLGIGYYSNSQLLSGRLRLVAAGLVTMSIVGGLVFTFYLDESRIDDLGQLVETYLAITDPYRGVDSGLTGRLDAWVDTLDLISRDQPWLIGSGYRTGGEAQLGFSIDNGYLTLLFEVGLAGTLIIVSLYVRALTIALRECLNNRDERHYVGLGFSVFLIFVLTNNVVARYLFGMGNPVSILALIAIVASREDYNQREDRC